MYTVVMSNERMDLDAPVLGDSLLDGLVRQRAAGLVSEVMLFCYQMW